MRRPKLAVCSKCHARRASLGRTRMPWAIKAYSSYIYSCSLAAMTHVYSKRSLRRVLCKEASDAVDSGQTSVRL